MGYFHISFLYFITKLYIFIGRINIHQHQQNVFCLLFSSDRSLAFLCNRIILKLISLILAIPEHCAFH